ncbi:MAG: insulinase family protein, partial [Clostridia bacterium]
MIFDPYLVNGLPDEKIVENEKHLLADAIKSQIDNKSSYAIKRCSTLMCADELFSISSAGYIDDLSKITPKDLSDALVFARDNAAIEIVFAGKADNENLVSLLKTTLPFSPRTSVIPQTFIKTDVDEVKTISENMDVTQGKLTLGFRSPITLNSPDYIKFALFNELFGGSSTSKLFMNVREKLSLCYYCQTI